MSAAGLAMNSPERKADRPEEMGQWARALFEAIDDAIFVHDEEGRILEANPAACRRLGYTREEMLRLTTRDIDEADFAAGFAERFRAQVAMGRFRCEGRHRTKDGRIIPVDINTSAIELNGKPAILAVMRDITARKLAEARQQAQYAVARALAEAASLEDSARRVLQITCGYLQFDVAALWVISDKDRLLECLEFWHSPEVSVPEFEAMSRRIAFTSGIGLPGRVWASGQPHWLAEISTDPNFPRATVAVLEGLKVGFAFPVKSGQKTIGIIEFFNRTDVKPDDDLLAMMASLGSQIGQVLERQRVEKALHDSEALFHSLVECLPQNIFRKDLKGRFTFGNQLYCATVKRSLEELVGKTDFDLFPLELARKYVQDDEKVLSTGKPLETVEEHCLPDGSKIYVQVVKTPVRDAEGAVVGTQAIFWDVTERIEAEQAVRESERRYRQLTEATHDAIIVTDQDAAITLFNPAAEHMFGYSAAEVAGKPVTMLMASEYRPLHERGLRRYVETRQARLIGRVVEVQGLRKDGTEFPIEIALTALEPEAGSGQTLQFLAAMRDLTERNRMRAALIQNEKLASIGLLSAGVAHEINNPLAFVANNLAVLDRDSKGLLELFDLLYDARGRLALLDPKLRERVDTLASEMDLDYVRENWDRLLSRTREGVDRVSRIVQSMRGFARTDSPKKQEVNLADLVESSLEILRGKLKRYGIEVVQDHDALPRVTCVHSQISQVMLNLLVNAVQAIEATHKPGGRVTVRTRRQGDEMLIEIADNGCGIDPAVLPRIFDPFFTTKDVGEGTGLGLSITHNIITAHGGRIEVEGKPGQGSCFRLHLPLAKT